MLRRMFLLLLSFCIVSSQYDQAGPDSVQYGQAGPPSASPPIYSKPINSSNQEKVKPVKHVMPTEDMDTQDMIDVMSTMDSIAAANGIACPMDVLFVVDSTSSVKSLFEDQKNYIIKVLEGLTISEDADHVGLFLFASQKRQKQIIRLGSVNNAQAVTRIVKNMPFMSGVTATGAALRFAEKSLASRRPDVNTNVVVITDGYSYDVITNAARALRHLPKVRVYAVSIGDMFVKSELEIISGSSANVLFGTSSYGKLVRLLKECTPGASEKKHVETATVHYVATETDKKGRHLIPNPVFTDKGVKHLDDRMIAHDDSGNSTEDYSNDYGVYANDSDTSTDENSSVHMHVTLIKPPKEIEIPSCPLDLAFVFDASGSVEKNFHRELQLASNIVDKLKIGPDDSQVAAVKFAGKTKCRVLFNFTSSYDKKVLKKNLMSTVFMSGTTYTNNALMKTSTLFNGPEVRASKAIPVVIIFTDGFSGEDPSQGAATLHHLGVYVFAIAIDDYSSAVNMRGLQTIAGTKSRVFMGSKYSEFERRFERLRKDCNIDKQK